MNIALTIAGSDSSGGAGIQADLKTFAALRVYGMSVLTAVTAQNTVGVQAVHELPPEFVIEQLDSVMDDIGCDACKTGMLATEKIIEAVAAGAKRHGIEQLVVDPVMVAQSGDPLIRQDAQAALVEHLAPLALVITPNIAEAEVLAQMPIDEPEDLQRAARAIADLGPEYVVIKGGHRAGAAIDIVFDGDDIMELEAARIETPNTHGTGCTFSAAIAAELARGEGVLDAIGLAKQHVTAAIAASLDIGAGSGPTNHLAIGQPL
ncbi:MAG: bifunctional hydroxymethylpyrimidine kinase/phosphomethylpyrimidine kinase [Armatimonadota bacterium]|jgi:hydroxymethylpyrimidine/phosphomethylpyrimidine kinase